MSLVTGLHKNYGDFTIDIPKWELEDQGVMALFGPSGSGKTSIFRILLGLEACPSLTWILNGENLALLPVRDRKLGVVFQTYELFGHLTALENILFAEKARQIPQETARKFRNELVESLGLKDCMNQRTEILSGGQKQRVALARALAGRPRFLFLDEPFSAIDEGMRAEARRFVAESVERFGIPTLLITHDRRDIESLNAKYYEICNGRLL